MGEVGSALSSAKAILVTGGAGYIGAHVCEALAAAVAGLSATYPGIEARKAANGWEVFMPDALRIGHEEHFAQVTRNYLRFLAITLLDRAAHKHVELLISSTQFNISLQLNGIVCLK